MCALHMGFANHMRTSVCFKFSNKINATHIQQLQCVFTNFMWWQLAFYGLWWLELGTQCATNDVWLAFAYCGYIKCHIELKCNKALRHIMDLPVHRSVSSSVHVPVWFCYPCGDKTIKRHLIREQSVKILLSNRFSDESIKIPFKSIDHESAVNRSWPCLAGHAI